MKKQLLATLLFLLSTAAQAQTYTSYFTGNTADKITVPTGGICLMGGATESDDAMRWFLKRASGGDVLVLRASGSNGYNDYLYTDLGIAVNSVESIVCLSAAAAAEPYIHQKIAQAEAIWFAGGDQWKYISYWRGTPVDSLLNAAIRDRNIVVGGTSAGMAIQGQFYFSAKNGTVTSAAALANPYQNSVQVDSGRFVQNKHLRRTLTDTHFDNPDRKGRLATFLARIFTDYGTEARAIACDEYTAVCIDPNGTASVYGGYPTYDDNAYFIQTNCELPSRAPEHCIAGSPLDWNLGQAALAVYKVKGTTTGSNQFNLSNWSVGSGGAWEWWWVSQGQFLEASGQPITCISAADGGPAASPFRVFPNPASASIHIVCNNEEPYTATLLNLDGKPVRPASGLHSSDTSIDVAGLPSGIYVLMLKTGNRTITNRLSVE